LLDELRAAAVDVARRAAAPYSRRPSGAALLLSDGLVVRGARVESASYSLVIPAVQNAVTTAVALGRTDFLAVAVSEDSLSDLDAIYIAAFLPDGIQGMASRYSPAAASLVTLSGDIQPQLALPEFVSRTGDADPDHGIRLARVTAERAHVPFSRFPVGCIAVYEDGFFVPGVNVEHPDWSLVLCAERNLLGTLVSYGLPRPAAIYLSCLLDPSASPCGACRQILVEQTPFVPVWLDRGSGPAELATPEALLPGSFTGRALLESAPRP
jgi:homotetrameric cytidine deaminase